MKIVATEKSEQNQAALDPWSVVHFASGLAAGLMGIPRNVSIPTAVIYEIAEQYVERTEWGKRVFETKGPESLSNVALDLATFAVGQWLGERWNRTGGGAE